MNAITVYVIESIAITGVAYLIYEILLRNLKAFRFNRAYLLLSMTLSLLAPALHLDSPEIVRQTILQSDLTKTIAATSDIQDQFSGELIAMSPFEMFSTFHLIGLIYIVITTYLLVQFMVSLVHVFIRLDKSGPRFKNMHVVYTDDTNPHSFFNYLFLNKSGNKELNENILLHESAHGEQYHTADILYCALLSVFFWFNPFVWMMKRAIAENHEFLADDFVVRDSSEKESYAQSILSVVHARTPIRLTSHFSYKLTKNRIQMIFRNTPHPFKRFISISTSMVLVVSLFAISACTVTEKEKTRLVIIDAGHGGKDPGVKLEHTTEKNINMAIASKIKELAAYSNVEVLLTRDDDDFMSISERSELANSVKADLFLSIHASQAESSKSGMEVFVANEGYWHHHSEEYGKQLVSRLEAFEDAPVALKGADFKILKDVQCPTVLVAVGFLSNEHDLQKLTNEDYQHQLAYEIVKAIDGIDVGN